MTAGEAAQPDNERAGEAAGREGRRDGARARRAGHDQGRSACQARGGGPSRRLAGERAGQARGEQAAASHERERLDACVGRFSE